MAEELKAIKGLFTKGQSAYNGWARCTREKVAKLEAKIEKAGFDLVATKRRRAADYSEYQMQRYEDAQGNIAYLMLSYGLEEDWPGGSGKFTWGNVDIYRGTEYYNKWWEDYDKR